MQPWSTVLLRELQRSGFAELAGARASVDLPIADWWLSGIVTGLLKPDGPVREVGIQALAGNELIVRIQLRRPKFLPAIKVRLTIEEQPQLPAAPLLILKISRDGITDIARTALRFLDALPTGIRLHDNMLLVDLDVLARRHGFAEAFDYLTTFDVTTGAGRVVVRVEAAVLPAPAAKVRP